ncbi:MAG: hypothetical protein ACHQT8_04730 [Chlamydiales bacterium]
MSTISFSTFSCLQQLDQEVARVENTVGQIESQLQLTLSSTDYYRLFNELDQALLPVRQLKEGANKLDNSSIFMERLASLDERSRTLYGNLINSAASREVVEIKSEAMSLEKSLTSGNMRAIAQKVDALKHHISAFKHDHRLSTTEIVQLSTIERFLARVEKFLESPNKLQQIRLHNLFEFGEIDPVTAELLMELFELAELFESGHPLASKRKEKLPVSVQKRIEAHAEELEKSLEFSTEKLFTCAVKATALELSSGGKLHNPLEAVLHYYEDWEAVR